MTSHKFSKTWNRSTQPRKQRKYGYEAPLHLKQKKVHVHLSPELRKKYQFRNVQLHRGDKVRILKGQFAKKEGKVDKINIKKGLVFIANIEVVKKDGTKLLFPLKPSTLMILDLDLSDRRRKQKIESKSSGGEKAEKKSVEKEAGIKSGVKK